MAPSFDCCALRLFCTEEDISVFYHSEQYTLEEEFESTWYQRKQGPDDSRKGFGGEIEAPMQSEENLVFFIEKEGQHLPRVDYLKRLRSGDLDSVSRKEAVDWISKVHARFDFGPLCAYLSINYLDRFLSVYELPKGKAWMMQLLAVACLSLAAKVDETELPVSLDLQVGESKFVFEARTIQRVELLVLSTLSWRMHATTPFSFIDFFLNKINNDETPSRSLILQSVQLIICMIRGIDFLEFKPSEIAAAVAIAVGKETKTLDTQKAIFALSQYAKMEKVMECVKLIHGLSLLNGSMNVPTADGGATLLSVPQSPIGVLDAACLSFRNDEKSPDLCASSSYSTPDNKRRRLNR